MFICIIHLLGTLEYASKVENVSKVICHFTNFKYVDILCDEYISRRKIQLCRTLMKDCDVKVRMIFDSKELETSNLVSFSNNSQAKEPL